ncbi:MAG: SAM-dependent methyltransferase [Rhodospirillales bacterium]|nr:SAM-dependent methyltransferase [Rhodospirillales bacterium]
MHACLADPDYGYYRDGVPLGAAGDFTTAPEISQVFGEMLGLWLADRWQAAGAPARAALVELGPGRGTLMDDALRAAAKALPAFAAAAKLHLVEISRSLRAVQGAKLARAAPVFHDDFGTVPDDAPVFLVANEFLDALPVRQFVRRGPTWRERVVTFANGAFAFADGPAVAEPPLSATQIADAPDGAVVEACPAALDIATRVARRIAKTGGAALFVDYGTDRSGWGDTLQAVRRHAKAGVFDAPGECDLTAHVDFPRFAAAARANGAAAFGPATQGDFLRRIGIHARLAVLARGAAPQVARNISDASRRLLDAGEMGTLFKVVALQAPAAAAPPGFEG